MAPFEALYGRRCRSPIGWFDAFEVRPWGTDLSRESLDKVSSMKGVMRFGKKGKLSRWYTVPFEIIERIGEVAYQLALPPCLLGVHHNLTFEKEPITIFDRQIQKLCFKENASVKVQWKYRPMEEAT
ncbi:uncharacterized protein [Solanum lycopersicum]|uniref:uncharacterized protein n=1 Tax=Solanum lycopersicum TaxID=4081 RepID=UPI0037494F72